MTYNLQILKQGHSFPSYGSFAASLPRARPQALATARPRPSFYSRVKAKERENFERRESPGSDRDSSRYADKTTLQHWYVTSTTVTSVRVGHTFTWDLTQSTVMVIPV